MNVRELLANIRDLRVLVVGDICLDRWCYYDPAAAEPSAETGIPRVAVVHTDVTPGAGGTIANNLAALGVREISVLGVIGDDGFGFELRRILGARRIESALLVREPSVATFTYTKLINRVTGVEDRPRVDYINELPMPEPAQEQVANTLNEYFETVDVVIVSDQAETSDGGVVTPRVRDVLNARAKNSKQVVWVDSRRRAELFRHVCLKPNRAEAEQACARLFGATDLQRLARENALRLLVVTHGPEGALLIEPDGRETWSPGRKVQAVDICGAGDSFSAGAACALAVTGSAEQAAAFGNLVASITVTKRGTGTASPPELEAAAGE